MSETLPTSHTQDLHEIKRDVAEIRRRLFEDDGGSKPSMQTRIDRLEQAHATHAKAGWIVATVAIGHAIVTVGKKLFAS